MRSPEQLRAEVQRLLFEARTTQDRMLSQTSAAQALVLAQEAEAIASLPEDAEGLRLRIAQYQHMLRRVGSEPTQRVVAQLLRDAEERLHQIAASGDHETRAASRWPDLHCRRSPMCPTRLSASP